ncbi:hypothetical protein [Bradyrhizobium sp. AZCC 2289]|uniref:hypothetical protein n=1 Tax=Bradyrhizobium sp. AZCC 2289 TaxID=3117026 RepID=UPI002FF0DF26
MRTTLIAASLLFSLSCVARAQSLPTAAGTDDIMKLCAGGRALGIEGEVKGELTRFLKGAEATGQAKLTDFGAVLDKLKPDAVGVEFYKIYTQCLKDQAEITLRKNNVTIADKLNDIDKRVKAQPLTFPKGVFSGGMMLRKVRVGRFDTVIRIFDASCDINVWAAMWVFPLDRTGDPMVRFKMTPSGRTAKQDPFEMRFGRDSKEVDDAGYETQDAEKIDVDQKEFIPYALSKPPEIEVYMAFRPMADDCTGTYSVEYEPKNAAR